MQIRFLLGPAGSGKTFRCLAEIRELLLTAPEGPPLILLAPKQATFQLERQLLDFPGRGGQPGEPLSGEVSGSRGRSPHQGSACGGSPGSSPHQGSACGGSPGSSPHQGSACAGSRGVPPRREKGGQLQGYTRLHILSFERLAEFVFSELRLAPPDLLSEQGRIMVFRALLARERNALNLFHATARLPGFARQLSLQIRELQRYRFSPATLNTLAAQKGLRPELQAKLHDLALLFDAYLRWLEEHRLDDVYRLPDLAADALTRGRRSEGGDQRAEGGSRTSAFCLRPSAFRISGLWLDGFAEMTPQELNLLAAMVPECERATVAFCLDDATGEVRRREDSWRSHWSPVRRTFEECKQRLEQVSGVTVLVETLLREPNASRFSSNPELAHLEQFWTEPAPFRIDDLPGLRGGTAEGGRFTGRAMVDSNPPRASRFTRRASRIRLVACANPEAEAVLAAREILQFVRKGGRYREAAVIVRDLEAYRQPLERAFRRFEIPCFLDQREPAAHHPLAELTRGAVRTAALGWQPEDWFGTLKTGLVPAEDSALDWLENEAIARGWKGQIWRAPIRMEDQPELEPALERLRRKIVPPFEAFQARLARRQFEPTGPDLAEAIRELWRDLQIERQLEAWSQDTVPGSGFRVSSAVHATVWEQMNEWLDMVGLAFSREALPVGEWLPVLEAGLADLTVGVIPPALDQVLAGAIDRSRNPNLKLAVVLGLNESVFPAAPSETTLLTEADRDELSARLEPRLGPDVRRRLARERYYGYIAFTRPRERLLLAYSEQSDEGQTLNPSPFVTRLQRLFPGLETEYFPAVCDWPASEHVSELIPALLRGEAAWAPCLEALPRVQSALAQWRRWQALPGLDALTLSPGAVLALYGTELRSSTSALEQFAACPFQFLVNYGLRARERQRFEADPRQTGSFQHEILSRFHEQLRDEGKRWRDLTPQQARERIAQVGAKLAPRFSGGLFQADAKSRFLAASLIEQLQDFIEAVIGLMGQYHFDPHAVEVSFGLKPGDLPAWRIDLGSGQALLLRGKIDRVDLYREPGADAALAVVMDYKSSPTKIDPTLLRHGLELQLFSYLGALRRLQDPKPVFGVATLVPVGVFYVPLRARAVSGGTRREVLGGGASTAPFPYPHLGRFDAAALLWLDSSGSRKGTQFKYSKNQNGEFSKTGNDAMPTGEFIRLLDMIEDELCRLGQGVFSGCARVHPYRKGNERACDVCACQTVCRFDPWVNSFRVLQKLPEPRGTIGSPPAKESGR